jgi:16S rRNA (guanine527-N7)-methyltransferase
MSKGIALREAEAAGLVITKTMQTQLERYLEMVLDWNTRMNLTAIEQPDEIWIKHFYDSWLLALTPEWNGLGRLVDIGAGAGFPGIPLKIVYPALQVVLLETSAKKVEFLRSVVKTLGLNGIQPVHDRAEHLAQIGTYRESFHWVVARAVAALNVLAEYSLPFVMTGGWFAAYKGPDGESELDKARAAIELLGGQADYVFHGRMPLDYGDRTLVMIQKRRICPSQYPRKAGIPLKRPL